MSDQEQIDCYARIIEHVFFSHYSRGDDNVPFERHEIEHAARELDIKPPKNLGDVIYTFRYRRELPESIRKCAPEGKKWAILPSGRSMYAFVAMATTSVVPSPAMAETKVPDSTPGVIEMYALSDEQSLLAKLRYNRLIDIFTGVTCYSLQSHLRTFVSDMGQVETDEVYVGLDRRGAHYIFPVQAKGGNDKISIVQIAQDFAMCEAKFPSLVCRPIAAQFMKDDIIALFDFERSDHGFVVASERHYRLVAPDALSREEIEAYRARLQ